MSTNQILKNLCEPIIKYSICSSHYSFTHCLAGRTRFPWYAIIARDTLQKGTEVESSLQPGSGHLLLQRGKKKVAKRSGTWFVFQCVVYIKV